MSQEKEIKGIIREKSEKRNLILIILFILWPLWFILGPTGGGTDKLVGNPWLTQPQNNEAEKEQAEAIAHYLSQKYL